MSPRISLIACAFLASASALAQGPVSGLPSLPGIPFAITDTVSVVKALAHSASDLDKFVGLNPKAQISQAQVAYQDDGYQVTITSQVCDAPAPLPALPPIGDPSNPFPPISLPPISLSSPCKTYAMLVILATADTDAQDGYTYQTLFNSTLRRK